MSHILMVSHSRPVPQLLEKIRKALDCHLETAGEGIEALDKAKFLKPDLILMNPHLPGMNGYETCRRLKSDPDTEKIPVIFLSEESSLNGELLKGLECGANDVISLTTAPDELIARLQVAIRLKQALNRSEALAAQLNDLNTELYERNRQVEKDLYVTRQLQQSLLPPIIPEETPVAHEESAMYEEMRFTRCHYRDEKIQISGIYLPCDALGGDLYDVIPFNNGSLGITVADVSGHGVPAGFITAIYKAAFYRITHTYETPGDILFHMNNELANIIKTGEYVTCLYCRIKDQGSKMEYSGAGHPYPIYFNAAENSISRLTENGTPLVWVKDMDYPMGEISLHPGDKVLLFTDGISEIKNPSHELYGEPALETLFQQLIHDHPNDVLDKMLEVLSDFTQGHPLDDDMSLVLIECS